jgi:multidrug efflux pump subunit AcrB
LNAIVLIALKRPLTFVVLAILILLFGVKAVVDTPTDVFPNIGIPVVAAVWTYNGLTPDDMSGRIVYYYERSITTVVSNIEHVESQSVYGYGVVKIFFHPGTDINAAQAQIAAVSQTVLKQMPAGVTPPLILVYNASSVPVMELQVSSSVLPVGRLQDLATNFIRPALVKVQGAAVPLPSGGVPRYVAVDLNQAELLAHGLSANDVVNALNQQNIVVPAGDQKVGHIDYLVQTNAAPDEVASFNNLPLRKVGNATIYLRDVANVHNGGPPQTNMVLVKGQQAVLLPVLKTGNASTLQVVAAVKKLLPQIEATLPPGTHIEVLNDASNFVRQSVMDVVREMTIAAALTGFMVLLFLGSWRSTLIVATSIPLSILSSIIALSLVGQTINVMTLGGLALAVGILVDDATVMIENITTHREQGQELHEAIIDAANQIVVPTFVSTLCICIVFLPLLTLSGVSGYLFLPLAEAIVFAMIASFILSRTLVPTMAAVLLRFEHVHGESGSDSPAPSRNPLSRFHRGFERTFHQMKERYSGLLSLIVERRRGVFIGGFMIATVASMFLILALGQDFFPDTNASEIDMHMRAQIGTRIEDTGQLALRVESAVKDILPPGTVRSVNENIGLPIAGVNLAYLDTGTIGPADADFTVSLSGDDLPSHQYEFTLRRELARRFPGVTFSFLPGDITAKILNFGLPAPIDVQVVGRDLQADMTYAQRLLGKLRNVPGLADTHIQQALNEPTLKVDADRSYATDTHLTERDIAQNALITLSGSGQVQPSFWLDSKTGVSYLINAQTPQPQMSSVGQLETTPIDGPSQTGTQLLGALSTVGRVGRAEVVSHYDIMPVVDIYSNTQVRDLGSVYGEVQKIVSADTAKAPRGVRVELRGQATTINSTYLELIGGLAFSVLLVYLIIVVNFQSWLDPFIIITALPAAIAGIVWSLFITHTTLSVPALTGAIMCMGTATANSILVVSYARERFAEHGDATRAAVEAGYARLRPVLMTALAMIIGMAPMAMSNSENAPLGRAVMGGLTFATLSTLLFVPAVFAALRQKKRAPERARPAGSWRTRLARAPS